MKTIEELRAEFEETETARFWMHRTVRFDNCFKKYYTADIEYSHYAQVMNSAFMMFQELKK